MKRFTSFTRIALCAIIMGLSLVSNTSFAQNISEIVSYAQGTPEAKNYTRKFLVWTADFPDSFRTLSVRFDDEQKGVYTQLVTNAGYVSVELRYPMAGEHNTAFDGQVCDFRKNDKVWSINGVALLVVRCHNVIKFTGQRQSPISLPSSVPATTSSVIEYRERIVEVPVTKKIVQRIRRDVDCISFLGKSASEVGGDTLNGINLVKWFDIDDYSDAAERLAKAEKWEAIKTANCEKLYADAKASTKVDLTTNTSRTRGECTTCDIPRKVAQQPGYDDQYYQQTSTQATQTVMTASQSNNNGFWKGAAVGAGVTAGVLILWNVAKKLWFTPAQGQYYDPRQYYTPKVYNDVFVGQGQRATLPGVTPNCPPQCTCDYDQRGNWVVTPNFQGNRIQTASNQGGGDFLVRLFGRN